MRHIVACPQTNEMKTSMLIATLIGRKNQFKVPITATASYRVKLFVVLKLMAVLTRRVLRAKYPVHSIHPSHTV